MPSGAQVRAARALLGWSQDELANLSGVSVKTVARAEASDFLAEGLTTAALRRALEENGVEFFGGEDTVGVSIRVTKSAVARSNKDA